LFIWSSISIWEFIGLEAGVGCWEDAEILSIF